MWIQRMSGTLSGFRCLPQSMCAQRSKDCRARPFGVNQRGLGSQVWRRLVFLLTPDFKICRNSDRNSFLVMSRQLIVDLLLRGWNRGVPKTLSPTSEGDSPRHPFLNH